MAPTDLKLRQLELQHDIQEMLRVDNGVSCHFDYHIHMMSDEETIQLNLLTFNPRHHEYMLLHSVKGKSSIHCLELMKKYVEHLTREKIRYSYTIKWRRLGEGDYHISYFHAASEEEAIHKFLHEKRAEDYEFSVKINPIA